MTERCAICGCQLHRTKNTYARPTVEGRSHATSHHYVAERFFGRSTNRLGTKTEGMFPSCPWGHEGESAVFCYECHEELIHNPVFLPEDIVRFAALVRQRGLSEETKTESREYIAGRVSLFHEVIVRGLTSLLQEGGGTMTNPTIITDASGVVPGKSIKSSVINPNRPWIGSGYSRTRIFVLGESYTGAYIDDLEYDDSYMTALLAGESVLGPELFIKMAEKLEMSLGELWQQVAFTNMSLGSIGKTNATKVTPAQLRAGRPRLESLLVKHSPRGVLILGVKTAAAAEPVCQKLGIPFRTVYHPSGINNANPKTACTPTMLKTAWNELRGS